MDHFILSPESGLSFDPRTQGRSDARLIRVEDSAAQPIVETTENDRVLLGARFVPSMLPGLLNACKSGRLGGVSILADGPLPPACEVGLRARPWLQMLFIPSGFPIEPPPSAILPPRRVASDAGEVLQHWPEPPVRFREVPSPFPSKLQIQTTTRCEAGCPFCPKRNQAVPPDEMGEDLFSRIVDQCRDGKPDSVELYFHAEPLCDPRIERFASTIKEACRESMVAIITSDTALEATRIESLAQSGLDVVFVSVNPVSEPGTKILARRLDELADYRGVFADHGKELAVVTLANLYEEGGLSRMLESCRARDLPIERFRATSRAGGVELDRFANPDDRAPERMCERPFEKAYIRYNGEVPICCEDWEYGRVLGDVRREPIESIWAGPAYRALRAELLRAEPGDPCIRCDYVSESGGGHD